MRLTILMLKVLDEAETIDFGKKTLRWKISLLLCDYDWIRDD